MPSIRRLKKEVEYLSAQVIGDCIDFVQAFNGKETEAMALIDEVVALHNDTLDKINHPDGKDNPRLVKAFYQQLKKSYLKGVDEAYKKLEELLN